MSEIDISDHVQPILVRMPPPSVADKSRRGLWLVVWATLFRWSPTPFHAWRRLLLRVFGARIEEGAHPYPSAWIWAPWNLEMGRASCLGPGVDCYSVGRISLGARCVVSQRVYLCAASDDYRDPEFPLVTGSIEIGEGAWVAAEALVGPGVVMVLTPLSERVLSLRAMFRRIRS